MLSHCSAPKSHRLAKRPRVGHRSSRRTSCQSVYACLQVADASKQVKRVLYLLQPVQCVCFLNAKGDILAGLGNRVVVTPADAYQYLSPQQMQQLLAHHAAQAAAAAGRAISRQAHEVRGVFLRRGVLQTRPCQHSGSGLSWQAREASPFWANAPPCVS